MKQFLTWCSQHSFVAVACLWILASGFLSDNRQEVVSLEDRRELFVDTHIIDSLKNVTLQLHHPHREGVAVRFNNPWEGPFSGYATVILDGDTLRLYYRGLPRVTTKHDTDAVTCYAVSVDGKNWVKPDLGLFEVSGTRKNNVVLAHEPTFSHNFTPFLDRRPGVESTERFKAVAGDIHTGLVVFVSADGIHWRKFRSEAVFKQGMFDSQNVVFWSDAEQLYACYFRTWTGQGYTGYRTVSRTTSPDLITWSQPVEMTYGDSLTEHIYTNATQPYFRAPHIYLSLAKRFFPDKAAAPSDLRNTMVVDSRYGVSSSDAILMSTRGGHHYVRTFKEAFIRPGPAPEDWVARDNTPALGLVPGSPKEIFIYRMSHYAQPSAHLARFTLRTDGFVSVHAPYEGGEMVTKPFTFKGNHLEINFESSAGGAVRVEVQTASGLNVTGFSAVECREMSGDGVSRDVVWQGNRELRELAGKVVRLRFVMNDADLYSFRFR